MKYFPIKAFSGVETKATSSNQDRGTLRRAEGVLIAPARALSSGPSWATAWGFSALAASLASALSGADSGKVHFVKIADSAGNTFLLAWDLSTTSARGLWIVANGTSAPNFGSGSGVTITATSGSIYRDKTAALQWFGSWIGNRLILGNGTDTNLVWTAGALALFGPSSLPTTTTKSKYRIPPCKSFVLAANARIYAAGNVTYPRRIYRTEPANQAYPTPDGLLTDDRSFTDLNRYPPQASSVTALSGGGNGLIAHLDQGGAVSLTFETGDDGGVIEQGPLDNASGAPNPACVTVAKESTTYLGSDLELYVASARAANVYNRGLPRDVQIETRKASGQWNRDMTRGQSGQVPFIIDDNLNGRVWVSAQTAMQAQPSLYCFDRSANAITGPFWYPWLSCAAPLLRQDLSGAAEPEGNGAAFVVVAVSNNGALLYTDLGKIGEVALDDYGTSIGSAFQSVSSQPTPTRGLTCIGLYNSNQSFALVDRDGNVSTLASPWADWVDAGTSVPGGITTWYNDAYLARVEFSTEDFGSPVAEKDFCEVRPQWRRNQRVYAGVFAESGGQRGGKWLGTPYPDQEQVAMLEQKGTRLRLRLLTVCFYAAPACLPDLSVGIEVGGPR